VIQQHTCCTCLVLPFSTPGVAGQDGHTAMRMHGSYWAVVWRQRGPCRASCCCWLPPDIDDSQHQRAELLLMMLPLLLWYSHWYSCPALPTNTAATAPKAIACACSTATTKTSPLSSAAIAVAVAQRRRHHRRLKQHLGMTAALTQQTCQLHGRSAQLQQQEQQQQQQQAQQRRVSSGGEAPSALIITMHTLAFMPLHPAVKPQVRLATVSRPSPFPPVRPTILQSYYDADTTVARMGAPHLHVRLCIPHIQLQHMRCQVAAKCHVLCCCCISVTARGSAAALHGADAAKPKLQE
jgi:hypothetical protein